MSFIENFIEGLKDFGIDRVVIDYNGVNKLVYLSCLQSEIEKFGIMEVINIKIN